MILTLLALALLQDPVHPPPEVIDRHSLGDGLVLQTFEVRDLLPEVVPPHGSSWSGEEWEQQARKLRQPAIDSLVELIKAEVQPPDQSKRGWSLRITPSGTLVLHAAPAQQEWVRQFLERNRTREVFVTLESTWIEGPKGSFERMGIPPGASASLVEDKDRARLLALGKDDSRFEVMQRPRLSLRPLAVGTISTCTQIAYIKSFKLETVQPGNQQIADPEVAVIDEGLELGAQAALLDEQKLSLSLEATTTAVRRPIATKQVRLSPDLPTEVTIALPEVDRKSIQARCTLASDKTVVFCAPLAGKDEREMLILVRARAQSAGEVQAPPAGPTLPR